MKLFYLTFLEGYSPHNRGLFYSQVIKMIESYNSYGDGTIELISIIREKQAKYEYINELAFQSNVKHNIIEISNSLGAMFSRGLIRKISNIINKHDDAVVICRESIACTIALKTARFMKKPVAVILDKRGLPSKEALLEKSQNVIYRYLKSFYYAFADRYAIRKADGIRCVSNNMKSYILHRQRKTDRYPIIVTPTGICDREIRDINNMLSSKVANSIVYVGGRSSYQRIDEVMSFMSELPEKDKSFRCYLVTYLDREEEDALSKRFPSITFISNSEPEEITALLNLSEYGVCFRDNSIVNEVSSPTKIAEYLTRGMKVVYTGKIGVIDDLIEMGFGDFLIDKELFLEKTSETIDFDSGKFRCLLNYFSFGKHFRDLLQFIDIVKSRKVVTKKQRIAGK